MDTVNRILAYIAARLREPSTYPAIFLILTGLLHYAVPPEARDAIMALGIGVAGLIGAALPDRIGTQTRADDPEKTLPPERKEPQ